MSEVSLPVRIRRAYRNMGSAQRRIAEYLLDHPHEAAFLTTTRLGEIIGVSESTVVRLAMSLGYSGYPELQVAIQESLREVARIRDLPSTEPAEASKARGPMKEQLAAELANLDATVKSLDEESLDAAVSLLLKARQVFVIGVRSSFAPAHAAWMLLNRILRKATLLSMTGGSLRDEILPIGKDDVLLVITVPRYARETLGALERASSVGAGIVAITDSLLSNAAEKADVVLLFRHLTPSFFNSSVGALAIVNALAAGIVERLGVNPDNLLTDLESVHQHFRLASTDKEPSSPVTDLVVRRTVEE
ncbi:MAG: MurR/RpiR family transcriptional regulator [Bacillota bacterium]|nr:MurR/RpiR family transcriptional regulator [Bacillota bacterium]